MNDSRNWIVSFRAWKVGDGEVSCSSLLAVSVVFASQEPGFHWHHLVRSLRPAEEWSAFAYRLKAVLRDMSQDARWSV